MKRIGLCLIPLVVLVVSGPGNGAPAPARSAEANNKENEAVSALQSLGASAFRFGNNRNGHVQSVTFIGRAVGGVGARGPMTEKEVEEAVALLANLPQVENLDLYGTPAGDKHVGGILKCRSLARLDLTGTRITDDGFQKLKGLAELKEVLVGMTGLTDLAFVEIDSFANLEKLSLPRTEVGDKGLERIVTAKRLTELNIGTTKVTDEKLAVLQKMPNLKGLTVSCMPLTDKGLAEIGKIKTLTNLEVHETNVTAGGLATLVGLKKLHRLVVPSDVATDAAAVDLHKALPGLREFNQHVFPDE
jgi:hypothetical protein